MTATRTPAKRTQGQPNQLLKSFATEPVRFTMNVDCLVIQPQDTKTVDLGNGKWGEVEVPAIRIERGNIHDTTGATRWYDRTDPQDKAELDAIDRFIERYPSVLTDERIKLQKHTKTEPVAPYNGYDESAVEGIRAVLENSEWDLPGLAKYELEVRTQRTDKDGKPLEPREDVLALIDELVQKEIGERIVESEQGADL